MKFSSCVSKILQSQLREQRDELEQVAAKDTQRRLVFHVGVVSVNDYEYMFHLSYVRVAVALALKKINKRYHAFRIKVRQITHNIRQINIKLRKVPRGRKVMFN